MKQTLTSICIVIPCLGLLAGSGLAVWAQQKAPLAPIPPSKAVPTPHKTEPSLPITPASQPLELRMKFKQGDVNKYQMTMQASIQIPGQPQGAAAQYDTNMNMILQQRVAKVKPDGSAVVAISTLSGTGTINGQVYKPDISGKPSLITFDAHNNIVAAKDLPKTAAGADVTSKIFQSGALSTQGVYLPKQPVKVGDKWTQKVDIAGLGSSSRGTVQTTLVRLEPVGLFNTARLHSVMSIPFILTDTSVKPAVPRKGLLTMNYDSNLALLEGKVVRSTGNGSIAVLFSIPGTSAPKTVSSPNGKPNTVKSTSPAAAKPTSPATVKVIVKLALGNNLITQ